MTVRSGKTPGRVARHLYFFMGLLRKSVRHHCRAEALLHAAAQEEVRLRPIADRVPGVLDHLCQIGCRSAGRSQGHLMKQSAPLEGLGLTTSPMTSPRRSQRVRSVIDDLLDHDADRRHAAATVAIAASRSAASTWPSHAALAPRMR